MAAITTAASPVGRYWFRTVTASVGAGQTDWLLVPHWAHYGFVFLQVTTNGGDTTPGLTPSFLTVDPIALDDSNVMNLGEHTAFTKITGATQYVFQMGPGVSGVADDVTNSATADSYVSLNVLLPPILGVKVVQATGGTNSYAYSISVTFRP